DEKKPQHLSRHCGHHHTFTSLTHILDDMCTKLGAFYLRRTFHQACEVICDGFVLDSTIHSFVDQIGSFLPAHMLQHHHTGQDNRTRVNNVLVSILRCSTMSRFEDGMASNVVDVRSRCDSDAANLCCQSVG